MIRLKLIAVTVALCILPWSTVRSQTDDDTAARLAELEQSVSDLKHWRFHAQNANATQSKSYVGFSFVFTKLHFHESFRAIITEPGADRLDLVPYSQRYEVTPRIWIGFQGANGLGVRATYWNYDYADQGLRLVNDGVRFPGATVTSVIFPALISTAFPGDALNVNTQLSATTLDLEGTYELRIRQAELLLSGGLRYGNFDQRYNAAVTGLAPASLRWSREFEGLGPTVGADMNLPLFGTSFYATGGARLSFLFGEKDLNRTVVNDLSPIPAPATVQLRSADEVSGAYATRLGLGRKRQTDFGDFFLEGAYEAQLWTAGGAPTLTFLGFNSFNLNLGWSR
jgi:Legionella pneumophila major outer membrane protein precursor